MRLFSRKPLLALSLFIFFTALGSAVYFFNGAAEVAPQTTKKDAYRYSATACWFTVPWNEDIRCGELHTPKNSGAFVLPVVVIRDSSADHQSDPVMFLQGGPGESAGLTTEGMEYWLGWRTYTGLSRDIILMDPRGVGRSKPSLSCKAFDDFSIAVLSRDLDTRTELAEGFAVLKACFADLRKAERAFSINHYGTRLHAQDVQALMPLLHYSSWNLLGVSYGTRVAIEVANQSPQVRSVILDSVYPATHGGLASFPQVLDGAFRNFFAWCDGQTHCGKAGEDVKQKFLRALAVLKKPPLQVTVPRYDGEAPVEMLVNDQRFVSAVFSALYSKYSWARIPPAISAAIQQNAEGLMPLLKPFINNAFAPDFSSLAFMAIDCADEGLGLQSDYQTANSQYSLLEDYTKDLWSYEACQFLSNKDVTNGPAKAIPHVPALMLAGDLDPITPRQWAEELHRQWPASQLIVAPDTGHAVINSDDCIYTLLRQFLDAPLAKVDAEPCRH